MRRPTSSGFCGSLGGVIVLLLWFYISALAVLTGAEMNAEIEHTSPYGKAPGEKVPGQKKMIGSAARRAWEARMRWRRPRIAGPARLTTRRPFAAYAVLTVGLAALALRKRL